jgi:hypothetical protein
MKATLRTYSGENVVSDEIVEINDNYDGNAYGDTVPFAVASNQRIIVPAIKQRGTLAIETGALDTLLDLDDDDADDDGLDNGFADPIAEVLSQPENARRCMHDARRVFGDRTTTEAQYNQMEKALGLGYIHCPEDMRTLFLSTLNEATTRRAYFEKWWEETS